MNIDNNIGGSAHQSRSSHIEKVKTETPTPEQQATTLSGSKISFVNALETNSLASVLWTVNSDTVADSDETGSVEPTSQLDSAWFRQAYTEH